MKKLNFALPTFCSLSIKKLDDKNITKDDEKVHDELKKNERSPKMNKK